MARHERLCIPRLHDKAARFVWDTIRYCDIIREPGAVDRAIEGVTASRGAAQKSHSRGVLEGSAKSVRPPPSASR